MIIVDKNWLSDVMFSSYFFNFVEVKIIFGMRYMYSYYVQFILIFIMKFVYLWYCFFVQMVIDGLEMNKCWFFFD